MRHVLTAWEPGGGYGHMARLLPIAYAMREGNVRVTFAGRRHSMAATGSAICGWACVPAPLAQLIAWRQTVRPCHVGCYRCDGRDKAHPIAAPMVAWAARKVWSAELDSIASVH